MGSRVYIALCFIILTAAVCTGYYLGMQATSATSSPEIQEKIVTESYWIKPEIIVVDREVEVPVSVPVEVTREVPAELKQFPGSDALKEWLAGNNVDKVPQKIQAGDLVINWDCDDYALALQRDAIRDGYLVNLQVYSPGKLPMSDRILKQAHAMCNTVIGDEVWLIEPASDECWLAYYLDKE